MGKKQKARRIGSKIHNKINRIRQSNGLSKLKGDATLRKEAERYAREMAKRDQLGHNVDGTDPQSRYSGSGNSENCAQVWDKGSTSQTADKAVSQWMNSPGHKQNILRSSSSYEGIGVWFRGNKVYIAQAFARRRSPLSGRSVSLKLGRRFRNARRRARTLGGRLLETPWAPLRALNRSWWQVLPWRRQRSLSLGVLLGALVTWLVLERDLLTRLPDSVTVSGVEVELVWILVGLIVAGEIVRYRS